MFHLCICVSVSAVVIAWPTSVGGRRSWRQGQCGLAVQRNVRRSTPEMPSRTRNTTSSPLCLGWAVCRYTLWRRISVSCFYPHSTYFYKLWVKYFTASVFFSRHTLVGHISGVYIQSRCYQHHHLHLDIVVKVFFPPAQGLKLKTWCFD